jgi:hypothetical protein
VTYDQQAQRRTQAEQDEPFFVIRMVRVVDQHRVVVEKNRLRFLERNAVLAPFSAFFRSSHSKRNSDTQHLL